jgi:hypothetical protein
MDPGHWSWGKLAALGAGWLLLFGMIAAIAVARVISHAKETDVSGGEFIVTLPYGTRHLTIYILIVLLPLAAAIARKIAAG